MNKEAAVREERGQNYLESRHSGVENVDNLNNGYLKKLHVYNLMLWICLAFHISDTTFLPNDLFSMLYSIQVYIVDDMPSCYAHYCNILHSSQTLILLTCSTPGVSMYFQS